MTTSGCGPARGRRRTLRVAAAVGLTVVPLVAACTDRPRPPWPTRTTRPAPTTPTTPPPTTTTTTAPTTTTTAPAGDNAVTFQTAEFTITRMVGIIRSGTNTVTITNVGQYTHEVIFVKADSYASLPKKENGAIDMAQVPAEDRTGDEHLHLSNGQSATFTVDFTPGRWVAFCNIEHNGASHFARGQFLEFTVL